MSMTLAQARQCRSCLLNKLSDEHYQPLLPQLEFMPHNIKDVIARQGKRIDYVYFPCTAAFSNLVYLEDGTAVEVGTIGNEGFTNVELLFAATVSVETAVCQIAGDSIRMGVSAFMRAIDGPTPLRKLLECAGQAYLAQVSQSVACNRMHGIENRFARWLLVTHDRVQGDEFLLTQEFIAIMLGVHRPSVSLIAGMFQQAGIIDYSRGRMRILNRPRLEEASCECYANVRAQFERLLALPRG
jgi:CRP-like cAMP-binding protein